MKLLVLCAILSVLLAVSLASPVKKKIHDESDSFESAESSELRNADKSSASSEEELLKNNEKINSSGSSEEQLPKNPLDKEEANEYSNAVESEEHNFVEVTDDNEILKYDNYGKSKRSVDFAPQNNNQLKVKDKDSIKYEKYLKLKSLRRSLESDKAKDFQDMPSHMLLRHERNADTSEEDSSEEQNPAKKSDTSPAKTHPQYEGDRRRRNAISEEISEEDSSEEKDAPNGVVIAKKPDTAPAESEAKPEGSRRRRSSRSAETSEENSSEEDKHGKSHSVAEAKKADTVTAETLGVAAKPETAPAESNPKLEGARRRRNIKVSSGEDSTQDQDINEVFIFSNEMQKYSDESSEKDQLNNTDDVIVAERISVDSAISNENKNSEEDYAQGCGGSNGNHDDDDSIENSNENNETAIDKF